MGYEMNTIGESAFWPGVARLSAWPQLWRRACFGNTLWLSDSIGSVLARTGKRWCLGDFRKKLSLLRYWRRVDQNVVLGQFRMALQACFHGLHRCLPERDTFVVHFAAQRDNRMQPLPGHLLGPFQHRLRIDQFRPIPLQFSDTPATLNRIIFAMVRRVIQQPDRLLNRVGKLYHTMQKLGASATALGTIVHLDLSLTR